MTAAVQQIDDHARFTLPRMPAGALKTITYALMHLVVAMGVAYALTGSWTAALAIGLIEPAVQTVAYSFHERGWARWGGRAGQRTVPACGHAHQTG